MSGRPRTPSPTHVTVLGSGTNNTSSRQGGQHGHKPLLRSPDPQVSSTSTCGNTTPLLGPDTLVALSSLPTGVSGFTEEGEVSSTSVPTATGDVSALNLEQLDAVLDDKDPFSNMSEEDIGRIKAALSTEEGRQLLQQTSSDLVPTAAAVNAEIIVETNVEPLVKPELLEEEEITINEAEFDIDIVAGLRGVYDFGLGTSFSDHAYCHPRGDVSPMGGDDKTADALSSPANDGHDGNDANDAEDAGDRDDEAVEEGSNKGGSRGRRRRRQMGTRRSTRIQDHNQREEAEKIRQENIKNEQQAVQAMQGEVKQYNMRTSRPQREDGRIDYTKRRSKPEAEGSAERSSVYSGEENDGSQMTESQTDDLDRSCSDSGSARGSHIRRSGRQCKPSVRLREALEKKSLQMKFGTDNDQAGSGLEAEFDSQETDESPKKGDKLKCGMGRRRGHHELPAMDNDSGQSGEESGDDLLRLDSSGSEAMEVRVKGARRGRGQARGIRGRGDNVKRRGGHTGKDNRSGGPDSETSDEDSAAKKKDEQKTKNRDNVTVLSTVDLKLSDQSDSDDLPLTFLTKQEDIKKSSQPGAESPSGRSPTRTREPILSMLAAGDSVTAAMETDSMETESTAIIKKSATSKPQRDQSTSRSPRRRMLRGKNEDAKDKSAERQTSSESDADENDNNSSMSWEDEEDPNRLWCICKKPYDNRFMIGCDRCSEWYHGSCVGITRRQGQQLAKERQQWTCPVCLKGEKSRRKSSASQLDEEKEHDKEKVTDKSKVEPAPLPEQPVSRKLRKNTDETDDEKLLIAGLSEDDTSPRVLSAGQSRQGMLSPPGQVRGKEEEKSLSESKKPSGGRKEIVEAMQDKMKVLKIRRDQKAGEEKKKEETAAPEPTPEPKEVKKKTPSVPTGPRVHCIMAGCEAMARPGHVYCSEACVFNYADESLDLIHSDRRQKYGDKMEDAARPQERIVVLERRTGKILTGPVAPTESSLKEWLSKHRSFEVLRPAQQWASKKEKKEKERRPEKPEAPPIQKRKPEMKMSSSSSSLSGKSGHPGDRREKQSKPKVERIQIREVVVKAPSKPSGPDPTRIAIRKAIRDVLINRAETTDDAMLSNSEIKQLALDIEGELFSYYGSVSAKYKYKYKLLLSNLKEPKNKLFHQVLNAEMKPRKLVRLTSESLASKISKGESSKNASNREKSDTPAADVTPVKPMKKEEKKTPKVETPTTPIDFLSSIIRDTTLQHSNHLFDVNCKVCMGQPTEPEPPARKKVSFTSPKSETVTSTAVEPDVDSEYNIGKPMGFYNAIPHSDSKPEPEPELEAEIEPMINAEEAMELEPLVDELLESLDMKPEPMVPEPMVPTYSTNTSTSTVTVPYTVTAADKVSQVPTVPTVPTAPPAPSPAVQKYKEMKEAIRKDPRLKKVKDETDVPVTSSPDQSGIPPAINKPPPPAGKTSVQLMKYSAKTPMWKGSLFAADVTKIACQGFPVSGNMDYLASEMPDTIAIMGRLPPDNVLDYLGRIKETHATTREVVVLRFHPLTEEEKSGYIMLYTYLASRNRCGVVGAAGRMIKDLYIVPLPAQDKIPEVLLPFNGPGLETGRPHLLLGIIVKVKIKQRHGETATNATKSWMYAERAQAALKAADKGALPVEAADVTAPDSTTRVAGAAATASTAPTGSTIKTDSLDSTNDTAPDLSSSDEEQEGISESTLKDPIIQKYAKAKPPVEQTPVDIPYDPEIEDLPYDPMDNSRMGAGFFEPMVTTPPGPVLAPPVPVPPPIGLMPLTPGLVTVPRAPLPPLSVSAPTPFPPQLLVPPPSTPVSQFPVLAKAASINAPATQKVVAPLPPPPPPSAPAPAPAPAPDALAMSTNAQMAQLLTLMSIGSKAASSDMTATMFATLAASSANQSLDQQRKLLADLTAKVEAQKNMLERKQEDALKRNTSSASLSALDADHTSQDSSGAGATTSASQRPPEPLAPPPGAVLPPQPVPPVQPAALSVPSAGTPRAPKPAAAKNSGDKTHLPVILPTLMDIPLPPEPPPVSVAKAKDTTASEATKLAQSILSAKVPEMKPSAEVKSREEKDVDVKKTIESASFKFENKFDRKTELDELKLNKVSREPTPNREDSLSQRAEAFNNLARKRLAQKAKEEEKKEMSPVPIFSAALTLPPALQLLLSGKSFENLKKAVSNVTTVGESSVDKKPNSRQQSQERIAKAELEKTIEEFDELEAAMKDPGGRTATYAEPKKEKDSDVDYKWRGSTETTGDPWVNKTEEKQDTQSSCPSPKTEDMVSDSVPDWARQLPKLLPKTADDGASEKSEKSDKVERSREEQKDAGRLRTRSRSPKSKRERSEDRIKERKRYSPTSRRLDRHQDRYKRNRSSDKYRRPGDSPWNRKDRYGGRYRRRSSSSSLSDSDREDSKKDKSKKAKKGEKELDIPLPPDDPEPENDGGGSEEGEIVDEDEADEKDADDEANRDPSASAGIVPASSSSEVLSQPASEQIRPDNSTQGDAISGKANPAGTSEHHTDKDRHRSKSRSRSHSKDRSRRRRSRSRDRRRSTSRDRFRRSRSRDRRRRRRSRSRDRRRRSPRRSRSRERGRDRPWRTWKPIMGTDKKEETSTSQQLGKRAGHDPEDGDLATKRHKTETETKDALPQDVDMRTISMDVGNTPVEPSLPRPNLADKDIVVTPQQKKDIQAALLNLAKETMPKFPPKGVHSPTSTENPLPPVLPKSPLGPRFVPFGFSKPEKANDPPHPPQVIVPTRPLLKPNVPLLPNPRIKVITPPTLPKPPVTNPDVPPVPRVRRTFFTDASIKSPEILKMDLPKSLPPGNKIAESPPTTSAPETKGTPKPTTIALPKTLVAEIALPPKPAAPASKENLPNKVPLSKPDIPKVPSVADKKAGDVPPKQMDKDQGKPPLKKSDLAVKSLENSPFDKSAGTSGRTGFPTKQSRWMKHDGQGGTNVSAEISQSNTRWVKRDGDVPSRGDWKEPRPSRERFPPMDRDKLQGVKSDQANVVSGEGNPPRKGLLGDLPPPEVLAEMERKSEGQTSREGSETSGDRHSRERHDRNRFSDDRPGRSHDHHRREGRDDRWSRQDRSGDHHKDERRDPGWRDHQEGPGDSHRHSRERAPEPWADGNKEPSWEAHEGPQESDTNPAQPAVIEYGHGEMAPLQCDEGFPNENQSRGRDPKRHRDGDGFGRGRPHEEERHPNIPPDEWNRAADNWQSSNRWEKRPKRRDLEHEHRPMDDQFEEHPEDRHGRRFSADREDRGHGWRDRRDRAEPPKKASLLATPGEPMPDRPPPEHMSLDFIPGKVHPENIHVDPPERPGPFNVPPLEIRGGRPLLEGREPLVGDELGGRLPLLGDPLGEVLLPMPDHLEEEMLIPLDAELPPFDGRRPFTGDRRHPDERRHLSEDRRPPLEDGRGPPMDDRRPPHLDDRRRHPIDEHRGSSVDDRRGPHRNDRRGPPMDDRRGGPPMDERRGGPPMDERRGGPPMDERRGGPPMDERRGGPPMDERRGGPPMDERRGGPPMDERRGGPPIDERSGGPPMDERRGGPHIDERRGGPPMDHRRGGPPMDERRDGPPMNGRRGGPPMDGRRGGPPMDERRGGPPMDEMRGGPPMDERRGGPHMDRRRGGPPMDDRRGGPPMDEMRGGPPMDERRGGPPIDERRGGPPMDERRGGPPMDEMRGGPPMDERRGGPPMDQRRGGPPMDERRGGPPMDEMRGGPPMNERRGRPPMDERRGGPPMDERRGGPHMDERRGGPHMDERRGGPPMDERRGGPHMDERRGGPPINHRRGGPPMDEMRGMPMMEEGRDGPPEGDMRGGPPVGDGPPMDARRRNMRPDHRRDDGRPMGEHMEGGDVERKSPVIPPLIAGLVGPPELRNPAGVPLLEEEYNEFGEEEFEEEWFGEEGPGGGHMDEEFPPFDGPPGPGGPPMMRGGWRGRGRGGPRGPPPPHLMGPPMRGGPPPRGGRPPRGGFRGMNRGPPRGGPRGRGRPW